MSQTNTSAGLFEDDDKNHGSEHAEDESPNDQFASSSFRAKRSEVEESREGTKRNTTGSFDSASLRSG